MRITRCHYCRSYHEEGEPCVVSIPPTKEPKDQRVTLIDYMKMKVEQEDWHAVADAANDLRELDAYEKGVNIRQLHI